MKREGRLRPSPALIVAMIALVAAMSGAAVALPGKDTVSSNDIKQNAIKSKHVKKKTIKGSDLASNIIKGSKVKNQSLTGKDVEDGSLTGKEVEDGSLTGDDVADDSLSDAEISDYEVLGASFVRVEATEAASEPAAQAAAPETQLFAKGQLEVYAKCFRDATAGDTFAEIYARTSADGAIMDGVDNHPDENASLLDADTPEEDRELETESVNDPDEGDTSENEHLLASPDGTALVLQLVTAVKQGDLPGGNGVFGAGDVCLFGGEVAG